MLGGFRFLGLSLLFCIVACARRETVAIKTDPRGAVVVDGSSPIDLGVVPVGGRESEIVRIINRTNRKLSIHAIQASCDCIATECSRTTMAPFGETYISLKFHLADESTFQGPLLLNVICVDGSGNPLLQFDVKVFVAPSGEIVAASAPRN
jgi:hypothetical protein